MIQIVKSFYAFTNTAQRTLKMPQSSSSSKIPSFPMRRAKSTSAASTSIPEFQKVLAKSSRVLALCGAGLSAASGLDTFRGAGGMWRNHKATSLATPEAFEADPGLVWLFYSYRRHRALQAKPNAAHYALAELSRKMEGFITLTQNVDGLSQRANHPRSQLKLLHGSLFDIKCFSCPALIKNNYDDPFHTSLAIHTPPDNRLAPSLKETQDPETLSSSTTHSPPSHPIDPSTLPHCPTCKTGLLRPGVVWFGESLPHDTLDEIDTFISAGNIDLILVIGTTATVYPAAGYVEVARARGARVAVVNYDEEELGSAGNLTSEDFLFLGDAAVLVPEMVRGVVGEVVVPE